MSTGARVALIALDAADLDLLDRLVDEGRAPVFGGLKAKGALGRLSSLGGWLPGSVWPTFFTSTPPSQTGFHHYLQWSPDEMSMRRPDPAQVGTPFWRHVTAGGGKVIALDMPFAPAPASGTELTGWATLDSLEPPRANPPGLLEEIEARHGPSPRVAEMHALQTMAALRKLRDEQIAIAEMLAQIAEDLLARERVDLLAMTFPGLHRGGHWLWDETGLASEPTSAERAELAQALPEVYAATDAALGRVLDAAQPDEVILFSLHGMGPNTSRLEILDEMLHRVLGGAGDATGPMRGIERLRQAVPAELRHRVKDSLPTALQDRLTGFWRTGGRDWQSTPVLTQVADLTGYLRLNIADRESQGLLSLEEARDLSERIIDGLASFVDADTGTPVVRRTARIEDVLPPGENLWLLPDLLVDWAESPAASHRAVVSPEFGTITWPTPGRHPSGRAGNHRAGGFYLACGCGLPAGTGPGGDIIDLAPTVLSRLGLTPPAAMRGRPLFGSPDP
ncbi:hypothetical protein [Tropicimonas aquimaris]|uniref:Type I phosphodiesterase / nucleotide pyrophosphatase n=1 Tax=Tropicimonas aquimaris TaxID=914152 RepID=A0ABW3IXX7_9RHOB